MKSVDNFVLQLSILQCSVPSELKCSTIVNCNFEAADILSKAYIKNEAGDNTMSQREEKNEAADIHHKNEAGDNSMSQDLKIGKEPMVQS